MFDYKERIRLLRDVLERKHCDAFITSFIPHLRYLTGFSGSNGLCIVTHAKVFFLTDFRYKEQIRNEVACSRSFITSGELVEKASEEKLLGGCKRVGVEQDYLQIAQHRGLKRNFHAVRFVPTSELVESLASVKRGAEILLIAKAVAITDSVFEELLKIVRAGISELDVSAEISYLHKKHGAENDSFEPIVVSGPRGSLPHGRPSSKKVKKGELVTLDLGCFYKGYCSDLTRTVAVGKPSDEARKVYGIVLQAQQRAIDSARSGVKAKNIDGVARGFISSKGYGKYFGHGLGHGIGLQIHEFPRISARSMHTLQSGNVVTVEPGIYLPQKFGIRIEDDIVIRDGTCDVLTRASKALIVV
ncbi:MAG: aminopeptidase P family protein [Bacteroidota bacterium]